jgi:hypothetical protein
MLKYIAIAAVAAAVAAPSVASASAGNGRFYEVDTGPAWTLPYRPGEVQFWL